MKKFSVLISSVLVSAQIVGAKVHEEMPEPGCCEKMWGWWDSLTPNVQLAVQLAVLLVVFYGAVKVFSCGCGCNLTRSCSCKSSSPAKSSDRVKSKAKSKPKAKAKGKSKARKK